MLLPSLGTARWAVNLLLCRCRSLLQILKPYDPWGLGEDPDEVRGAGDWIVLRAERSILDIGIFMPAVVGPFEQLD